MATITEFADEWITGPGDTSFFTRFYAPEQPKGVVVHVHGFAEHLQRYKDFFPHWRSRGFAVFSYDQRGFGKTALDHEKRSRSSVYGKFTGREHMNDIDFFIGHARSKVPAGTPVFLTGQSMGGGEVLSFCSNCEATRDDKLFNELAGVIAMSPFVAQTHPAPFIQRFIGTQLAKILPWFNFAAPVDPDALSRDKEVGQAYLKDPLVMTKACLRGLSDMLQRGDNLRKSHYQNWPVGLPLLIVHGDKDEVVSFKASKEVFDKITANDKTFVPFDGGYHELHNEPELKERVIEQCISWAEKHLHRKSSDEEEPQMAAAAAPSTADATPAAAEAVPAAPATESVPTPPAAADSAEAPAPKL